MPDTIAGTSTPLGTVLQDVRALGPTLRERALEADRVGHLADETIADLDAAGAFDIGSPAEYGGYEFSVAQQLEVITEVSKWDGSCGWAVWASASSGWIPVGSGKPVAEEVFGGEWVGPRSAGSSHIPGTRGRARRDSRGWVISGGPWTFGSGSLWAPYSNLGCLADDGDGPSLVGVTMPRDKLRFLDDWHVAGMRGTGSVSMVLTEDEVVVPNYRVAAVSDIIDGTLDHGLAGSLWMTPILGRAFSLMTGLSIGIAQGALERFLTRSAGRPLRGTQYKNQLEAPLTHLMLSEVHAKIRAASAIARANAEETDRLGALASRGTPADPTYVQYFSSGVQLETAYAAKWCAEAVELLQRNSGSTAIQESEPIQRAWRDARVVTLHGALHLETHAENHGRLMAGLQQQLSESTPGHDRFSFAAPPT